MKPCRRVGLDITHRCNWRCKHCFYLRSPGFFRPEDVPLEQVYAKVEQYREGGCVHAVMVGYGEPSLCQNIHEILGYCHDRGLSTSMITNGTTGIERYRGFFAEGMDHVHLSSHGLNGTLDEIVQRKGAFAKLAELKQWLHDEGLPFRTNVTLQQLNYRELSELIEHECEMGARHVVLLGFLPHYEWGSHLKEVAVHPAALRPYIEAAADVLLGKHVPFTIRYHPLCHLSPEYWPYVVNARYVAYDPMEWAYQPKVNDPMAVEKSAFEIGGAVDIRGEPCKSCRAHQWCGGWNRTYVAAFDGADLEAVTEIPEEHRHLDGVYGAMMDLNPATRLSYELRTKECTDAH